MALTTTPIRLFVEKLREDFSHYTFAPGDTFVWKPSTRTIIFDLEADSLEAVWQLLHEIAHAELDHKRYSRDIMLIRLESTAWAYAETSLAPRYNVLIDHDYIETCLDSYRDWLHSRSLCPECRSTGTQTATNTYSCFNWRGLWRVNDARICTLRRFTQQDRNRFAKSFQI